MMHYFARTRGLILIAIYLFPNFGVLSAEEQGQAKVIKGPGLEHGTLVICGGGTVPREVMDRFVELAGGKQARIVVIPTASDQAGTITVPKELSPYEFSSYSVLHTTDRTKADSDAFIEPLKKATGVWFVGGQQWRIAKAYLGTAVEREVYEVLKRGGVIAGTSAGAAIQSRVMISGGNPKPKIATGLDLIPNAIIDQHFTQRKRQPRLKAALKQYPTMLGVGIDEDTAMIVRGNTAKVMGRNSVHFYEEKRKLHTLASGKQIDLNTRKEVTEME